MEKIRLGVIGIGNMGSEHCRNILAGKCPEITLCAVADPREDRREWACNALPPDVRCYEDGSDLILRDTCDAVLIATPHPLHAALTVQALQAGKHVMCEKPAAPTAGEAGRMLLAARESGKTLALMFNQRTNCLYRSMKAELASGRLGAIKRVTWMVTDWYRTQRYYDSGVWRATWQGEGGGVLLNQCPHQLDLLIWLCSMPVRVSAHCAEGKWHHIEVEDDVTAYLEFGNGASGVFVASTGDLPGINRLQIDCERGRLICENNQVRCLRLAKSEREICFESDDPWYKESGTEEVLPTDSENTQHVGVLNAFAAHLLRGEPLVADALDGLRAIELSNAMHLAGWTGKTVDVPADEALFEKYFEQKKKTSRIKTGSSMTYDTCHLGTGSGVK